MYMNFAPSMYHFTYNPRWKCKVTPASPRLNRTSDLGAGAIWQEGIGTIFMHLANPTGQ